MSQKIEEEKKPFLAHLAELRSRLIICLIGVGISFIITYSFKEKILDFLMAPYLKIMPNQSGLIFTYITEAFVTYLKISFVSAVFLASPLILYEIWMFVAPGLYEHEKKYVYPFIFFGSISFVVGALFSYYVVIPYIYRFFVSFAQEYVIPMPDFKGYMSLTLKMLILFGIVFQLPLVMYYLGKAKVISYSTLRKKRKFAIFIIFVLSAIITPPDITSQILLAFPLIGLYELSIFILKFLARKDDKN